MRADILADGDRRALHRRRTGFGLAHAHQRHGAERCKTRGRETRTAKECTAIETATGLVAERCGKIAAPRLTFCSFDQHGVSPSARITVDPVERLHFGRIRLVAGLALFIVGFAVGLGRASRADLQPWPRRRRPRQAREGNRGVLILSSILIASPYPPVSLPPLRARFTPRAKRPLFQFQ